MLCAKKNLSLTRLAVLASLERMVSDQEFMQQAITEAQRAEAMGEVPVGAVIVKAGEVIARGHNLPIALSDPSAHAEVLAIRAAGKVLGNYRLLDCALYVTLEPCAMCVAALVHARIARVVFAAFDPKAGALGGALNLLEVGHFNHQFAYEGGLEAERCGQLLKKFFRRRRAS